MTESRTILDVLRARHSEAAGDVFVQHVDGETLTYAEAWSSAHAIAEGLTGHGVVAGDHVGSLLSNSLDAVAIWLAVHVVGAVDVSMNPALRGRSLQHVLTDSLPKVIFVDADLASEFQSMNLQGVEAVVLVGENRASNADSKTVTLDSFVGEATGEGFVGEPSEVSTVIYTSGTTGPAKGVKLPHRQALALGRVTIDGIKITDEDIVYCVHPLFHIAGKFMGLLAPMMAGARVVLAPRFVPEDWVQAVHNFKCTLTIAHGPMIEMICSTPESELDSQLPLRAAVACPLPSGVAEAFESRFSLRAREVWGMTEVGVPLWAPYDEPLRAGSCGLPINDDVELRIVDPETDEPVAVGDTGELVVRPSKPNMIMSGYLNRDDATVETWRNLWFHSGDLVRQDSDGYYYFVTRLSERIRRRAENISPYEIESRANSHPVVMESAAVGVASEFESDDDVKLVVALHDGAEIDMVEFLRFLAEGLPHHMVPRFIEVVSSLPRTPTNKVRKTELRDRGVAETTWDRKRAQISLVDLLNGSAAP